MNHEGSSIAILRDADTGVQGQTRQGRKKLNSIMLQPPPGLTICQSPAWSQLTRDWKEASQTVWETKAGGGEANRECLTLNPRARTNGENEVHYRGEKKDCFHRRSMNTWPFLSPCRSRGTRDNQHLPKGGPSQGCLTELRD